MGDIDQVFILIEKYLRKLDITKTEHVVFCADGARRDRKRIGPLTKKLGVAVLFEVIDYTHAKQNLVPIIEKLPKSMASRQIEKMLKSPCIFWKRETAEVILPEKNTALRTLEPYVYQPVR